MWSVFLLCLFLFWHRAAPVVRCLAQLTTVAADINSEMLLLSLASLSDTKTHIKFQIFRMKDNNCEWCILFGFLSAAGSSVPVLERTSRSGPLIQPLVTYIVTRSAGLQISLKCGANSRVPQLERTHKNPSKIIGGLLEEGWWRKFIRRGAERPEYHQLHKCNVTV